MKRGFTQTLMMAAIVLMAAQAMATAPIVSEIPSPVVGDHDTATMPNTFVYPDAIDLARYVTDTDTTRTSIKWYYEIQDTATTTTHLYKINGCDEISSSDQLDNPNSISDTKIIAGPGAQNKDPYTTQTVTTGQTLITIRDNALSPIGHPEKYYAPTPSSHSQVVTLYASDGETVTAASVRFYTWAGKDDYLSAGGVVQCDYDYTNNTRGTIFAGNGVSHTTTENGLCMGVGANGADNGGAYFAPFGDVQLVNNGVYRVRLVMNGTQTQSVQVPLWDVLVDNLSTDGMKGKMAYGADFWVFAGNGGTNAQVQFMKGDATFEFWYTPAAVKSTRWNDATTGLFSTSATADDRNGRITYRLLDYRVKNKSTIQADQTTGQICMHRMSVEKYDLDSLTVDTTPVWQASSWTITGARLSPWNIVRSGTDGVFNDSETPASDGITIKANSTSVKNADFYAALCPGDAVLMDSSSQLTIASCGDDYPCTMQAKTLYKITYTLSAPTQADADNPVDAIYTSSDMFSNELISESYTTNLAGKCGMPTTTAQPYIAFCYSNFGPNATGLDVFKRWRPYIALTNNSGALGGPSGQNGKGGAIKISGMKVEKVIGGYLPY